MDLSRAARVFGAGSGVLFALLVGAGMFFADTYDPATDPHPDRPAALLADTIERGRDDVRLGATLVLAGVFFLLWFLGYLQDRLRNARWIASVAFGAGLLFGAFLLVRASFLLAATAPEDYGADAAVAKTYYVWGWASLEALGPAATAFLAATAAGAYPAGLPKAVAWVGAALTAVAAVAFGTVWGMATMLSLLWTLGLAGVLVGDEARGENFTRP